ncbi:MAG: penicillin acylase family protein [Bacteroidetes bacterium]|nr:penicillin acylase family protein [Bacteroidota bacterium]
MDAGEGFIAIKEHGQHSFGFEYDIENTNFIAKYGDEAFQKLYPDFTDAEDPVIPVGTKWGFKANSSNKSQAAVETKSGETYSSILEKPEEINGSNNWAVSGSKTKSGKPILCNDPHLKLSLPSIWFEMHLVSPTMNVYGATLPGSPAVIIGFNDSISWGVTNGGRDVRDWYKIKFKDASREEYEVNGQWEKSIKKPELFLVRGKGAFHDTVVYTRFGPVVFDEKFGEVESKKNMAVSWTAKLPSNEFETFYGLNKGKNYDDYMQALKHYDCPSQNFVFASRSGDIAIRHQGKFPIVNDMPGKGKLVFDGSTDQGEWKQFIPSEQNPSMLNPDRGFVSSANQRPTDSTYPYYYSGVGVFENYRNRRINQLLAGGKDIDVDFMKKMQNDNFNLHASEVAPIMLSLLDLSALNTEEKKIAEEIYHWDFYNNPDETTPIYFEIWWNELRRLLWDEMADPKVPMKQPSFYITGKFLQSDSTSAFYDILSTPEKESRKDIVLRSFKHILISLRNKEFTETKGAYANDRVYEKKDMNAKDWGSYKSTKIAHLAGIDAFSKLNVYSGGNIGTINATNSAHGPSWRMIVDEATMKAYVVYPGGQSGNPGSPYYDNMVNAWAKGEYFQASFVRTGDGLGAHKLFISTFKPK